MSQWRPSNKTSVELEDKRVEITKAGSQASTKGPTDWFTGSVRIDPLFQNTVSGTGPRCQRDVRAGCADCLAHPSAGPDSHRHRRVWVGSTLGWADRRDPSAGDVVWFPPGEKHWHGAPASTAMTHIAIQESQPRAILPLETKRRGR